MEQKQVKIIGLSIEHQFGGLKAVNLTFNEKNRLVVIKGEVGAGKTTLNRAMRLTTQGSGVLTDKNLYGDIDVTAQLSDGDMSIFVGCRTDKNQSLSYFLYGIDKDGNKVKDVILDGQRATPANYLKSLQTALTWRLDELTSENPTVQRNILLELYKIELEAQGVIYDKKHPDYTKGIIHKIEVAKNERNLKDMKRKEVGGIADDMTKKGIKFTDRRKAKDTESLQKKYDSINAKITLAETNLEQTREAELSKLSSRGFEIVADVRKINQQIIVKNTARNEQFENLKKVNEGLFAIIPIDAKRKEILDLIGKNMPNLGDVEKEVEFSEKGKIKSKAKEFKSNKELFKLLKEHKSVFEKYTEVKESKNTFDDTELKAELQSAEKALNDAKAYNKDSEAVNSFHDWSDADKAVKDIKKDYYNKLTDIDTGVKPGGGIPPMKICGEDSKGERISQFRR